MNKRSISVNYDPDRPNLVTIGSYDGKSDPLIDLLIKNPTMLAR